MKTKLVLLVLTVSLTIFGSGCALFVIGGAAAAGAGGYAYVSGELRSSEAASFDKAWSASQKGLKDMGYTITEQSKDAVSGKLTARGSGDKKIQVTVKKSSETVTEIRIRVNTFGDETLSREILEKIKKHL